MTESLWDPSEVPQAKKFKPRKRSAFVAPVPASQPSPVATPAFRAREAPRDYAMEDAMRVCALILHPDEIASHPEVFDPSYRNKAGIAEWRRRNGLA